MHRFAVIAVVCSLVGVLTGAMVTSSGGKDFLQLHQVTAIATAVVVAILGVWLMASGLAKLGWTVLVLVAADAALGFAPDTASVAVLHALLAQILFAAAFAAIVATGSSWTAPPDRVEDHGWPSLSSLGAVTPVLVLIQIALGAAFRHKEMSVLSHLFFAMILVLVILCLCIFVMQQFPDHKALRPASNMLMAVAFTQIFLGIGAFTVRSMTTKVTPLVIAVTAAHVCVGAITLASAVMLSMQIRRNVYRKEEPAE